MEFTMEKEFTTREIIVKCMELIGKDPNIDELVLSVKKELMEDEGYEEPKVYKDACSHCNKDITEDTGYQCSADAIC